MTVELAHDSTGEGPLLVLVHGITENRHSWDPLLSDLARDHRVLRVDLRGHGESPKGPGYGVADLAADVEALVDAPPLLVGHSFGGTVVTAYAALFPARGVINVDQSLDLAPMQAGLKQQDALLRGPAFPAVMDALFDSLRGSASDEEWARLSALRRYDQDVVLGVWSVLLDTTPAELDAEITAMTSGITAPYLSLHGFDPGPGYAEWLAARIPGAVTEADPGVGHYRHLVHPEEFLARLRRFEAELPA